MIETPKLPKGVKRQIAGTKPLQDAVKRKILRDLGIKNLGAAAGKTRLSVRKPYAGSHAFLAFVGASAVNPAEGASGTAAVGSNPRQGDGLPFAPPMLESPIGIANPRPLDNALIVDFKAKKGYEYVVECAWHGRPKPSGPFAQAWTPLEASSLYTTVRAGDKEIEGGTASLGQAIVQVIPNRVKDMRVVVKVKSDRGFLASHCTITPYLRNASTKKKIPKTKPKHKVGPLFPQ